MCGIVGFNWNDKELVSRMARSIQHRGPDDHGYYTDSLVSLGHRRLSIIDLSKNGRQPLFNEDGSICVIFNGEIYNFIELRSDLEKKGHRFFSNTDTEVIVHSYEEYGERCVEKFNGCFAFAIYDIHKKKILLARDRIGIKPLYFYIKGDKFIFASEIKALLEFEGIKRKISKEALNNFLCLRYIPTEETILQDIFRIKPGRIMIYDLTSHNYEIKRYWQINNSNSNIIKKEESKSSEELLNIFEDSVKKRMISDVPIGAYLSGGIDSSAIVAIMSKLTQGGKVKTFSVGFEDDKIGNELGYASKVASLFNTDHKEIIIKSDCINELPKIVWHLDEPMSDPAVVPNYFLSREAKKEVTVILTGDGADECFAGYDQYKFLMMGHRLKHLPRSIRSNIVRAVINHIPLKILNKIYPYSSSTGKEIFYRFRNFFSQINENQAGAYLEIVSIFNQEERKELINKEVQPADLDISKSLNKNYFNNDNHFLNNLLKMDMERYLPEDLLMKPDKMALAFGVEARVPFLDHRLIEESFKLDPRLKFNGKTTKYILKKSMEKILPKEIIHRRKQPFVMPLDKWIEKDLKETFKKIILDGDIVKGGLVNKHYISNIFDKHSQSKMYYSRQIWSLANLEIWYELFMNQKRPREIL